MTIIGLTKSDTPLDGGQTNTTAHHVVTHVRGDPRQGGVMNVVVSSFVSKAAYDSGKLPFKTRHFSLTVDYLAPNDVKNLSQLLYDALKNETVQHGGFFNAGTTDVTTA